jgi:hypothetical protein
METVTAANGTEVFEEFASGELAATGSSCKAGG